jgi:hypothetical protein
LKKQHKGGLGFYTRIQQEGSIGIQDEAILGEEDVGGEHLRSDGMIDVVADVSEEGSAGADDAGDFDALVDGEVGGMGTETQPIEDEEVERAEEIERGVGYGGAVGEIGEVADAVAEDGIAAMHERNGDNGLAEDLEGAGDLVETELGYARDSVGGGEDVGEGLAENGSGGGLGPGVDGALDVGVDTDVVEAVDVVGMSVSDEDGVERLDGVVEHLLAEVDGGVDDEVAIGEGEENGRTETMVARVCGTTDGTVAGDLGDAMRGSGAEEGDLHESSFLATETQRGQRASR